MEWFQVDTHIIVSKQRLPSLVLGRGPTQSTITLQKETSETGTDRSGATQMFAFGFPIALQMLQVLQSSATSLLMFGR